MRLISENQALLEPIKIKTSSTEYTLETDFLAVCDICEQSGKLYIYLKPQNIYLPISKVESA
jgi:hypothetical protein